MFHNAMATWRQKAGWPSGYFRVSTVDRALKLMDFFSETRPEAGLSELARLAGYDKATTRRFLVSLTSHGYVEQDPESKKYHLGATLLRLAHVRETTYPVTDLVQPVLNNLRDQTNETAHFSLAAGTCMATLMIAESARANRVSLEDGERLPFHCTASGIAWLAFAPDKVVQRILSKPLKAQTGQSETNPERLLALIEDARSSGVAIADQSYEDEVHGIAAPVFDANARASGSIAVATPVSRITPEISRQIKKAVYGAAVDITRALGGQPDKVFSDAGKAGFQ
jgi:IclR family transcriptional regulator, acetate operon repressor